ncbi:uncharacterized protein EDB91DRAFT_1174563 [Suillus paluster]|uniref:uncharacterized protein n=1 Tax=Suillus paluster TaxID=48578 RepID=UPI001B860BEA|nr:uncharacterized protein EDB91DRAFT_1174563 [Suillus paluster]KAG1722544.1 hypothetical protein EDB91DRAFT_1174563 [Suillus paluster]
MPPRRSPLVRAPTEPLDASTLDWKFRRQLIEPSEPSTDSRTRALVRTHRVNNIVVQHARDLVSVPRPFETDDESVVDDETGKDAHSLKRYLQESWFPAFKLGPRVEQKFVWPHYPELQAAPGMRKLRTISRIMPYRIHGAVCEYLERQKDKQLERTKDSVDLTLPSINLMVYDYKGINACMQDVNFVTDITTLLMTFAFRTVARCLHILHDIPEGIDGDAFRKFLQFRSSSEMCPVKDNIFDVVSLPSPHPGYTSMIVLVVPPWAFDNMDFISFIDTGEVTPGSLDGIPTSKPASAPAILWALLWDMCSKQKCQYFAVTTYELWAFGNFSSNMENAYISDLFRAPVHSHDSQVQQDMLPSPSMSETLLFWMAACIGAGGIVWTPCDSDIITC